eukprot:gnl/MRDRNA2_/MRDRNA2_199248_c0_seq1.p1 gnl/MRDRNA2_/MRDRNA2_199248_c0~~gnl/MRDRNA2_/MRDRNA2_199248_c0_seq1.p1  ORF type:complete len:238 (+),score=42.42 gnl/MRDRNA2_/MRDRNA2_199248_c0_seq1:87-800(+)
MKHLPFLFALFSLLHKGAAKESAQGCECKQGCTELVKAAGECPAETEAYHGWPDSMQTNGLKQSDLLCYALKCEIWCAYNVVLLRSDGCEEKSPAGTGACAEAATETCNNALNGKYSTSTSMGVYRFIQQELDDERKSQAESKDIFSEADTDGDGRLNATEFAKAHSTLLASADKDDSGDLDEFEFATLKESTHEYDGQAFSTLLKELLQDCDVDCDAATTATLSATALVASAYLLS